MDTIYGQNAFSTAWLSCLDDTPTIQAWINNTGVNGGTVEVWNAVLKTPLDFTPCGNSAVKIWFGGSLRLAQNKAELEMVNGVTIDGGLGGIGGESGGFDVTTTVYKYNSSGVYTAREPNSATANGYVAGPYMCYQLCTGNHLTGAPAAAIGLVMQTTHATDPTWNGYWKIISSYLEGTAGFYDNVYNSLIYLGPSSPSGSPVPWGTLGSLAPTLGVTNITWSVIGTSYGGTNASVGTDTAGGKAVFQINQCSIAQGTGSMSDAWKHWMALSNCNNSALNHLQMRIMGAESNTICYTNATTIYGVGGGTLATAPTLPDYGTTGTSAGNANIVTFEQYPTFRMCGYSTNLLNVNTVYGSGPTVVIDGFAAGTTNCAVSNVNTLNIVNGTPFIVDGVFEWNIRNCFQVHVNSGNGNNAVMLLTCNMGNLGQYCSGSISNMVTYDGCILFQYATGSYVGATVANITIDNWVLENAGETSANVPQGNIVFDNAFASYSNIKLYDFYPADQEAPYLLESMYPGGVGAAVVGLQTNAAQSVTTFGPNLLATNPDIVVIGGNATTGLNDRPMTREYSGLIGGLADLALVGRNDAFSPVITVPYTTPIPKLLTPAAWNALGTAKSNISFGTTTGPDLSPNSAIVLSATAPGQGYIYLPNLWSGTPAVGDTVMVFMRIQPQSTTAYIYQANGFSPSIFFTNTHVKLDGNVNGLPCLDKSCKFIGGQWFDSTWMTRITGSDGNTSNMQLIMSVLNQTGYANYAVDPESIVVLYIPASSGLSQAEILRLYRKLRGQVSGATTGDVAIPGRAGLSLGSSSLAGSRLQTLSFTTFDTSADTAFSCVVPNNQAFTLKVDWTAICPSQIASGYISGGSFNVVGFANNSGSTTVSSVNTFGSNYNCGSGGAAAAAPITLTHGSNVVNIQVNANSGFETDWQFTITQTNLSHFGIAFAPIITSVSQNAGTVNGSTSITVTGSRFTPTMTSTLGAVSSITGNSCTITTSAHGAGAFTWTLANGAFVSATQTFTYLAHPGTPSAVPSSGPDNSPQAVTFTSSALPFGFIGVPFSLTVGGLTVTSLTATASTTATGTIPSGGADGAQNIVVTVDGISTTGTGAYTFVSVPPVITGFGSTKTYGSAGGETPATKPVINGTSFSGVTSVKLAGVEHISQSTVTSTAITVNTINAGTAGAFGTVTVVTADGTATYGNGTSTGWTYLPAGYNMYDPDLGITTSGGHVSQWNDQGDLTANNITSTGGITTGSTINSQTALAYSGSFSYGNTSTWTKGELFSVLHTTTPGTNNNVIERFGFDGTWFPYGGTGNLYSSFGCSVRQMSNVPASGGVTITDPNILQLNCQAGDWNMWINGHNQTHTTSPTISFSSSALIGETSTGNTVGGMVLVYANSCLVTGDRTIVKTFLGGKYGIAVV